ncbi:unnamed protein product [Urochloa humidicola]
MLLQPHHRLSNPGPPLPILRLPLPLLRALPPAWTRCRSLAASSPAGRAACRRPCPFSSEVAAGRAPSLPRCVWW